MIAPLIQKKINMILALAERAGTEAESKSAYAKAQALKDKYTVKEEPVVLSVEPDDELGEDVGFFYKEEGKEKAI